MLWTIRMMEKVTHEENPVLYVKTTEEIPMR